jgi:2-methylisocitrate lyase-like PEP mutase family enzyme
VPRGAWLCAATAVITVKKTSRQQLRALLSGPSLIVAPGIYDAYGARFVQQAGFDVCYMTGNGVSASVLGRPDVGLIDLTLMTQHAQRVAACIDLPLICDSDTGYGNVVNVRRTVQEFESAGVAAIHLEDQVSPKRCGHLPGARPVVEFDEAVSKIEAAVAARRDPDFVIIARTDADAGHGLDEVIRRGKAFRKAGADVLFAEIKSGPAMVENLKRFAGETAAPCLVNVTMGSPIEKVPPEDLAQWGFRIAIHAGLARNAAGFAIREALNVLKQTGGTHTLADRMLSGNDYNAVLGIADVEAWEKQYLR